MTTARQQATETSKKSVKTKNNFFDLRLMSFGESRFYILEYGVFLGLLASLTYIVLTMLSAIITKFDAVFPVFNVDGSDTLLLSSFAVVFPLLVILLQRTAQAESKSPQLKNLVWRKGLLGVFLAIFSVLAIFSAIFLVDSVLSAVVDQSFGTSGFDIANIITYDFVGYGVATALFGLMVLALGSDYRFSGSTKRSQSLHIFRYGLVIVSTIVLLLYLIFPFMDEQVRVSVSDAEKVSDLYQLDSEIQSFYSNFMELPKNIDELGSASTIVMRAEAYDYEYTQTDEMSYTLCADFIGDGSADAPEGTETFRVAEPGENCFSRTVNQTSGIVDPANDSQLTDDEALYQ